MIIDSQNISNTKYDLCVIGSGPAGIVCALEFAKNNPEKRVILVEFGGLSETKPNVLDDSINIVRKQNHHEPYECTNKVLGGTSATWGGRCVMYDEVDFIARPILNGGCTWPEGFFDSTKEFLSATSEYFECGGAVFDADEIVDIPYSRIADGFISGDVTDNVLERWSMPTKFGIRYRDELQNSPFIDLLLNAQANHFGDVEEDGRVLNLQLEMEGGARVSLSAINFVIAAGTQESTRILLKSPQVFRCLDGIPSSLGHYYQGHINGQIASVCFTGDPRKTDFGFFKDADDIYVRRRFQFSTEFLKNNNLLNTAIWLDNPPYYDCNHRSGALSFVYLMMITPILQRFLAPPAIIHSFTKGKKDGLWQHIWNVIKDIPSSVVIPVSVFKKRYLSKRKMPGLPIYNKSNTYALRFHAEQVPQFENRMELSDDGEKLNIFYSISDQDVDSVICCHEALDAYLRKLKCGYVKFWHDKDKLAEVIRKNSIDGVHQSGTTRTGKSPDEGVVDYDLKVFGTKNLYVCSSSAFPTSSQANPTFYTAVCAVRLADFLSRK